MGSARPQDPSRALGRTMDRIFGWLLVLDLALAGAACGSDTGAFCCQCLCCAQTATLTRQDQSWPNCDDPCEYFCEQQLACHQIVDQANACD